MTPISISIAPSRRSLQPPRVAYFQDLRNRDGSDPWDREKAVRFKLLQLSPRFNRGPTQCVLHPSAEGVAIDPVVRDRLGLPAPLELAACQRRCRHQRPTRFPTNHHRGRSSAISSISISGDVELAVSAGSRALHCPRHRSSGISLQWIVLLLRRAQLKKSSLHLDGRIQTKSPVDLAERPFPPMRRVYDNSNSRCVAQWRQRDCL